ncbi:hypothetical protein [Sneathiella sp. HT1-7]|uniref:hypothetical protein n=1 Tax=Sneathiella sp. HT1-7 TaxID=2887192 RepID=UPI001D15671A|nr:hypothetical protein [Sneathiella sp. HT1-7]MCC3305538.1 hypothetical protein [Sneathiella sp. HT1-7]
MDDFWNTVLIALISSASVGFFTLAGTYMSTRASLRAISQQFDLKSEAEHLSLLRSRGEELFETTAIWANNLFSHNISLIKVMNNEISYNDHLDLSINSSTSDNRGLMRIEMLIDVYFPNIREEYEAILDAREHLNNITFKHKVAYKNGEDGIRFLKLFQDALKNVEQEAEKLKLSISNELKSI